MLAVGEPLPEFAGTTDRGEPFRSTALAGRPCVVYFYPRAGTPGCRAEALDFAAHHAEFARAGVQIVGISVDPVEAQRRFAAACELPFPLLADADRAIARRFGVLGLFGIARRVTFWVGVDGRVREVLVGMLPGPHVRGALARLRAEAGAAPAPP